jgi:hypothetical protein
LLGFLGRTPAVWSLELMLKHALSIGGLDWNVRGDVFNAFNNHAELWNYQTAEDSWNGVPDEHFGETYNYQSPRSIRFGLGLSF